MEKLKNFFNEIGKSIIVFFFYIYLSIFFSTLFKNFINSKNFLIANFSALSVELLVLIFLLIIYRKRLISDFKTFKKDFRKIMDTSLKNWLFGLAIMLASNVVINIIVGNIATNEELNRNLLLTTPLYATIAMIIIAPIAEGIIFRLSPRKAFTKKIPYLIYSTILFGFMHLLSSSSLIELLYIIPYGALGCVFAKAFYETDNIWSSISVHMIHNTIAVVVAYISLLG